MICCMEKTSGFGWDADNHVLEASNDVWIPYLKVHQKRAKWQNKKFPNYLDLCVIFGKDRATEKDALSAAEMIELDEVIQTNDRDDDSTPTRNEEISSKSSTFKKRKRKSSFDIDSESAGLLLFSSYNSRNHLLSLLTFLDWRLH